MIQNVHCLSLRTIKHNDSTTIVTAWSLERGRISFAINSGSSREAQRRRAMMMPFSIFEGIANIKPGNEIAKISDLRPYLTGNTSAVDPIRNIISMFLADFLNVVLRESQPDANLTAYLFDAVGQLREAPIHALANFHLYFIYRLGQFLGISPDIGTYHHGWYFDLKEGIFTATAPTHRAFLIPVKAKMVYILSRMHPRNLERIRLSRTIRNEILDMMLDYYTMHHTPVSQLPSLQIIRSVFS